MGAIEITQLAVEDWQSYRQLRLEALQDSPQAFGSTYPEMLSRPDYFWQNRLEEAARGENSWLLFARLDGKLVGMMGAFRAEPEPGQAGETYAELVSVFVSPAARSRGVSTLLMQTLLDVLKGQGFRTVRLGVNLAQAAAVGLYRRFGFYEIDRVHHQMGDGFYHDEVLMEKILE